MIEDRFGSATWLTDALQAHFGVFDIDLAAEPWSAVVQRFVTKEQDLFKVRPRGEHGFLNPPYSRGSLARFVSFARESVVAGRLKAVTLLVPHYSSESWFRHVRRPEGRKVRAEDCFGQIRHPDLHEWTRYVWSGLTLDVIQVAGRITFKFPPRYRGARESARFSSVVVRFVAP